ncbi:prepilin-type N-terminal cleavage/methylation domain-containing protein [Pontibacillus yanchengensis]|uniref:Prepilin-type N-terminal cleavage/methylation domain-containing protein n=2 Tax=Pontibacillus yanchengensis TaxID=462910 RepID=A0ACC7VF52_9BACI|nr:competence type IV pilus major pilin ComGC [Pontibacillus yanchengensis]MYL33491.1 prepilin-type N-terminal cleavage/methylation domain-containing protein [Pontibacillus yanchengensis]MYL53541.1 prepilin-type N-terminal cleavage/methylation domain-containing protein [Pontibacillus yanchengensis]
MKNEKGFTLIEMLIVLMIISTLLLITIPHISTNNSVVQNKGCEAFIKLVETQAHTYEMDKGEFPESINVLMSDGYLESETCPNGDELIMEANGLVKRKSEE